VKWVCTILTPLIELKDDFRFDLLLALIYEQQKSLYLLKVVGTACYYRMFLAVSFQEQNHLFKRNLMIRIGIIGCGYWCINYVRIFSELPVVTVVRVRDRSEERFVMMHCKLAYVYLTNQLEELLVDKEIDTVIVSTEASTHFIITRSCLLHNKRVLVENL